jgi:Fe-S oxidoreductase
VAVACPYCLTMLDDGLKDLNADLPVKDVAELLAERV